jgi:hypothetical protein
MTVHFRHWKFSKIAVGELARQHPDPPFNIFTGTSTAIKHKEQVETVVPSRYNRNMIFITVSPCTSCFHFAFVMSRYNRNMIVLSVSPCTSCFHFESSSRKGEKQYRRSSMMLCNPRFKVANRLTFREIASSLQRLGTTLHSAIEHKQRTRSELTQGAVALHFRNLIICGSATRERQRDYKSQVCL